MLLLSRDKKEKSEQGPRRVAPSQAVFSPAPFRPSRALVRALSLLEAHLRSSLSRASSGRPRAAARAAAPSLLRPEPLRRMLVVQEGREATICVCVCVCVCVCIMYTIIRILEGEWTGRQPTCESAAMKRRLALMNSTSSKTNKLHIYCFLKEKDRTGAAGAATRSGCWEDSNASIREDGKPSLVGSEIL